MDGDAEAQPMMDEKAPEMMDPPMEEAKPALGGFGALGKDDDSDEEYDSVPRKDKLESCCCCLCVCENTATENVTCCCCCPIKCGV